MKSILNILLSIIFFTGCKGSFNSDKRKITKTNNYELIKADEEIGLLILFPGAGGNSETIKNEFNIVDKAIKKGVSVLMINFSRKLWVEEKDSEQLASEILSVIKTHQLKTNKVFIGGMSIGGNIAMTLSQYMLKNAILPIKGTFIIDSPIDLYGLYESSKRDVQRKDLSKERLAEPNWIISFFEESFSKKSLLKNIQKVSPYTSRTRYISNISKLEDVKMRFYIEPDMDWYRKVRQVNYRDTNAHSIQELYYRLQREGWKNIELIETKNKGYRSNGERNPHSWSIVEVDNLLVWMLT